MKIKTVQVHNFRSLVDVIYHMSDYSLLVGANNSGKTNVIDALRVFYDKDIKFNAQADDPKIGDSDDECWIEIEYVLTDEEYQTLKDEYKIGDNRLKVRKCLKGKKGIFAYTLNGGLASEQFYGAKNVQQGKLGDIIYIPAVSRLDEHMKTSGPSALRNIINGIIGKLIESSQIFQDSIQTFSEHMKKFQNERTEDGFSLMGMEIGRAHV